MKVLLVNGSPHKNGTTNAALGVIAEQLGKDGVESEIFWPGAKPISGCIGCMACAKLGRCVIEGDRVNEFVELAEKADGFIFGSPVYYAHPTGQFLALLDRMFYAGGEHFKFKPGAAIVTARRAGTTASLDVLNKYFTDACMPVVSSTYWNMAHGTAPEEIERDEEGLQTMRNLGHNMAWLLKCIEAGRERGITPRAPETSGWTNFIR